MARVTIKMKLEESAAQKPGPDNYRCQSCKLPCHPVRPRSDGPAGNLMVVYQAQDSDAAGMRILKQHVLRHVGVRPGQVTYVGAVRCRTDKPKAAQITLCSAFLRQEISKLKPVAVVACGADAARSCGVAFTANIGRVLPLTVGSETYPLAVTYKPEQSQDDGSFGALAVMIRHIKRVLRHGTTIPWKGFPEMSKL